MFEAQGKDIKEHLCLCKSASSLFLNPGIWVKGETFPFKALHRQLQLISEKKQEVTSMESVEILGKNTCAWVAGFPSSATLQRTKSDTRETQVQKSAVLWSLQPALAFGFTCITKAKQRLVSKIIFPLPSRLLSSDLKDECITCQIHGRSWNTIPKRCM